jgi:hypothetical protein
VAKEATQLTDVFVFVNIYTRCLINLIGSLALSFNVTYCDFVGFARISAIVFNSVRRFFASSVCLDVLKNMHRSSLYDVINMFILDDLFVIFFKLAHG